jgi:hypothetical protein
MEQRCWSWLGGVRAVVTTISPVRSKLVKAADPKAKAFNKQLAHLVTDLHLRFDLVKAQVSIARAEAVFQMDLGHYRRTFQDILARKTGYTNTLDCYRDNLPLRIQKIEEKHIK